MLFRYYHSIDSTIESELLTDMFMAYILDWTGKAIVCVPGHKK